MRNLICFLQHNPRLIQSSGRVTANLEVILFWGNVRIGHDSTGTLDQSRIMLQKETI